MITDRASAKYIPPTIIIIKGSFNITATTATAPPRAKEPVSPIKTLAGKALYLKKPSRAPKSTPQKIAKSYRPKTIEIIVKNVITNKVTEVAKPSNPSVRLTAFVVPAKRIP